MSEKRKINLAILTVFMIVSGLFFIGISGFSLLSGLRAYVGGEGLWAKGQKEATNKLIQYVYTGEESRYKAFVDSLKKPLGDKAARLSMDKSEPVEIITQGFVAGGNHPDDIPIMIFLYKYFRNLHFIEKAIEEWKTGDRLIDDLIKLGEKVSRKLNTNNLDEAQKLNILNAIDDLQKGLDEAENLFSENMSSAARWVANFLFVIMLFFTFFGGTICFFMMLMVKGIVTDLNKKTQQLENQASREKALRKVLAESEENYRLLVENINSGVFQSSFSGRLLQSNPKIAEMFGYDNPTDFMSKPAIDLYADPSDREQLKSLLLSQGEVKNLELKSVKKDGTQYWISINAVLLKNRENQPETILGIVNDITDRKRMELERDKLKEQMLQAQKMEAIGTLAGGIAHDFNNMLSVITGNISYALINVDKNDELYEVLLDVQESSKQAQSLTHQLLTFSKGGSPIKKVSNINKLINESAIFSTRGSKANCLFELSKDLWPSDVDEGQINQVIGNLIINANQAMPNGGTITIRTEKTEIEADCDIPLSAGRYIKIVVEDQGIGISKNNLPNIFEPYYTTKQKGSGLGLATVYSIIKRHGGHITVYSEIEKGTVFNIYLPASLGDIVEIQNNEEHKHDGQGKILIMDDQESILKMVRRILNKMGYDVTSATDGTQAINIYRNAFDAGKPFDLVILDLTVPGGMGGAKTIPELLKIDPNVKVAVSSGYSNDPIMANYEDYGFCGVVPKPYTKEQLSEVLNKIFC